MCWRMTRNVLIKRGVEGRRGLDSKCNTMTCYRASSRKTKHFCSITIVVCAVSDITARACGLELADLGEGGRGEYFYKCLCSTDLRGH